MKLTTCLPHMMKVGERQTKMHSNQHLKDALQNSNFLVLLVATWLQNETLLKKEAEQI